MIFNNLMRYAIRILNAYAGEIPLQGFLKNFYRENSQMGSRDRKIVTEMVYCFFRLGHALKNLSVEERIITGLFLSNQKKEPILENLHPDWHRQIEKPVEEKIEITRQKYPEFNVLEIFPWPELLSDGVPHYGYCLSFLNKPKLFIRIRPGREKFVTEKLKSHQINYENADPQNILPFRAFSFSNTTKLDGVFVLNQDAVIQDLSSQTTAIFFKREEKKITEIWDCCSGSGGKSILLYDLHPDVQLTVSDIRESILNNLMKRFAEARIKEPKYLKADLTDMNDLPKQMFPFIVADLPCTGSGTWSRTPEALYFFKPEMISTYRQRQEKILLNVWSRLKKEGVLIYITCSVFADENEKITAFIQEGDKMKLVQQQVLSGYAQAADSMFASRLIKLK